MKLLLALIVAATPLAAQDEGIADNSFLIEEAYNQGRGVVQHISAFARADGGDAWSYAFTQEWPLGGMRHQLSYTVPVMHGDGTGLGDVALNYRYQLLGERDPRILLSPRGTLLFPTGSEERGRGAGAVGFQVNLPLTVNLSPQLATHWNAGATLTPSARNAVGAKATTTSYQLGASAIWLPRRTFNVLVEAVWASSEGVVGGDATDREESAFINPGVRWAFNFPSGLQIVPGVAYTIGIGPSQGDDGFFLYLSFEHPFRRYER